ncbi:glycosyltransferase 87 family protein [Microbacterium invictum]|uniref:DUF2029 domain-containing protein n=1 Tax=Microbacterium invictum TaxID=515415 RepID=A0AA40SNV8_9MICO|nr:MULTISPECIES: glycosyltransferase 87 family protein [Microbacterium]MBB4139693.1 hypothetical protein [Microbacterium invictum]
MSRRAVLWVVFAVAHVWVAVLGFILPNEPMGDVYRVYEPWSTAALTGGGIVGIDSGWVYPQLALIPMVLTHGFAWIAGYTVGWALLVTAVDAVAFAMLVGRARSNGRRAAAWFWLGYMVLLGPVGMYRLDGFTVPLVIVACLWLIGRPWAAALLLAAATWIKVWPAAVLAAAIIAVRRRAALMGGAVLISVFTMAGVILAGGGANLFSFIADQGTRGLQIEAPVSTPYMWGALQEIEGFWVYYSPDLLTFEVTGTGIDPLIAAMTPVLVAVVTAVAVLGGVQAVRGARFAALFPALSLALVTGFIVCNKVGSPQYASWLIPSLVVGIMFDRRRWFAPAALAGAIALLTQTVYPMLYGGLLTPEPVAVTVLTLRNAALVALFVWMVARVARVPVHGRLGAARPASIP